MPFTCPACKGILQPVSPAPKSVRCANNHSFDLAKEGYVNLLLAQNKRSKQPGDDAAMMACRQAFLNRGHYAFMATAIANALGPFAPTSVLDIGCGEGYYGQQLHQQLTINSIGIDIAKAGVRLAAKRHCYQELAVASAFDLPLANASLDAAISVFAPIGETEAARVLKPKSVLVAVGPAPQHLRGLAEHIYNQFKPHNSGFHHLDSHPEFTAINHQTLEQTVTLQGSEIYNLLTMTPYYWSATAAQQEALRHIPSLVTPLAFEIKVYRRH
jgi:23S rRNA (guanine745-N1)-methyltransferase